MTAHLASLVVLESHLERGDYASAGPLVKSVEGLPSSPDPVLAQRRAAAVAQVRGYQGRTSDARGQLRPWLVDGGAGLSASLPPLARLQAAEYWYSLDQVVSAITLAEAVFVECEKRDAYLDAAAAAHAIARFELRRSLSASRKWVERALELLRDAGQRDGWSAALQWRLGLVQLIDGFTRQRAGDRTALLTLQVAASLLSSTGDYLAKAHVDQAIGAALRSDPDEHRQVRAIDALQRAKRVYGNFDDFVGQARVWTSIARVRMNQFPPDQDAAHRALLQALASAEKIEHVFVKNRQLAEAWVFLAWLAIEGRYGRDVDPVRAALTASELAQAGSSLHIDAELALGSAKLLRGLHSEAETHLLTALRNAKSLGNEKLEVHAHLCLSSLYAQSSQTTSRQALIHLHEAETALTRVQSRYLHGKLRNIREFVRGSSNTFIVTREELIEERHAGRGGTLSALKRRLDAWAIDQMESSSHLSQRGRARALGIAPSAYNKRRRKSLEAKRDQRSK